MSSPSLPHEESLVSNETVFHEFKVTNKDRFAKSDKSDKSAFKKKKHLFIGGRGGGRGVTLHSHPTAKTSFIAPSNELTLSTTDKVCGQKPRINFRFYLDLEPVQ